MTGRNLDFRCICFDCDSTLSAIEGIDELAVRAGCVDDIAPLTTAAMEGRLALEQVYGLRLESIGPRVDDIAWLGDRYAATIVEGAREAIARLQQAGRAVHIVSGGLKQPILRLAAALGVPSDNVAAVDVYFDDEGRYAGFDLQSPLARSDGKAKICAGLAATYGPVALVGDGMTDVAARAGGAYVIGFGGVARREAVVAAADHFIDGPSLEAVADCVLSVAARTPSTG